MTFDLAALQALPAVKQVAGTNTYTGVSLWTLLNSSVGIQIDAAAMNDILNYYVVATGSDGYQVVLSMGEISPQFGNQPDLIAYALNGAPLGANGFARLVLPNDVKSGRFVSKLIGLEVIRVAPKP